METIMTPQIRIHYDPREVFPSWQPGINCRFEQDGYHTHAYRKVLVTIDGEFAGTMCFSTEGGPEQRSKPFCYGQNDQIIGVPAEPGEQGGTELIARYYRKGGRR